MNKEEEDESTKDLKMANKSNKDVLSTGWGQKREKAAVNTQPWEPGPPLTSGGGFKAR